MTLFTVAHGMSPEEVLTRVIAYLPPIETCTAARTDWGAILVVNAPCSRVGQWLVAGMPQACPWGIPGTDLPGSEMASELDQYGPTAIQLATGPVVAIDVSSGAVLRALNGIIPVATSVNGQWAASSSREVVAAIAGTASDTLGPGCLAAPSRAVVSVCGSMVEESIAGVTWSGIDAEIRSKLAPLGRLPPAQLARGVGVVEDPDSRAVRLSRSPGRAVFIPTLSRGFGFGDEMRRYLRLRDQVLPRLWWRAWRVGVWLCAPAFERPAVDLVSMVQRRGAVT